MRRSPPDERTGNPCGLYHSALVATLGDDHYFIEMAPVPPPPTRCHPTEASSHDGAVGSPLAERLRTFRYEIRCWRNGNIPDLHHAVEQPCLADTRRTRRS